MRFFEEHYPSTLKKAKILPLYKGGTDVNNYRPSSLLPSLDKLFESIIYHRILKFLDKDKNRVISAKQIGFRAGHSCSTALLTFVEFLRKTLDKKQQTSACLIALTKAVDKLITKFCNKNLNVVALEVNF